jgi:hypothetical protein
MVGPCSSPASWRTSALPNPNPPHPPTTRAPPIEWDGPQNPKPYHPSPGPPNVRHTETNPEPLGAIDAKFLLVKGPPPRHVTQLRANQSAPAWSLRLEDIGLDLLNPEDPLHQGLHLRTQNKNDNISFSKSTLRAKAVRPHPADMTRVRPLYPMSAMPGLSSARKRPVGQQQDSLPSPGVHYSRGGSGRGRSRGGRSPGPPRSAPPSPA